MAKMSLELSDGLEALSALFVDYEHEARVLAPSDAQAIRECIRMLRTAARLLENEVSAKRWNEGARDDRVVEMGRVLDEMRRPGGNVVLFPIIPRPFSDGHRGGRA